MVQGDGSYWRNIGNESHEEYFKFSIEGYKEAISDRERDFLNFLEGLIQETRRRTKAKNPRKDRDVLAIVAQGLFGMKFF